MKNRQLSFKIKILTLVIVVGICWIIYGLLSLNSNKKLVDIQSLQNNLKTYVSLLPSLSSSVYSFEKEIKSGNVDISGKNKSETITQFTDNLTLLKNQFNLILENQYFFFHPKQEATLLEIDKTIKDVKKKYDDFLTLVEERGSFSDGLLAEWEAAEQELNDQTYFFNNQEIVTKLQQLIQIKSEYLRSGESDLINSLTQLAEQTKQAVTIEQSIVDTSFSDFEDPFAEPVVSQPSMSNINEILDRYTSAANKVLEKDIQIGLENESGMMHAIVNELSESEVKIQAIIEDLQADYEKIKTKNKRKLIFFWLLFTIVSVGLFTSIYIVFGKPLTSIKDTVKKLSVGQSPDKLKITAGGEFEDIANNLNTYSDSLKEKVEFSNNLASGNIDNEFNPISEDDELGNSLVLLKENLIKTRQEEEKYNIENDKRRWTNEGLAKFADILRQNNDNLEELATVLIMNLVSYINATQGGLFLINDDDKSNRFLELKAAVAYNRKKFITKKIEMGEGLIGTCAVEKKTTYLTEIPENYLEITSGLGDSNPRSILIVPLNLENEILGVIELAAFNEFKKHEIEFIEKIAESIASTLTTVKINERTSELLEQSQRQALEMTEQEEEMRQNMEELQATQEEAARRESEISSILEAVNSTSLVVEYDMSGHITNINQKFLDLLNTPKDDITGMHHSDFTSKNRTENIYIEFWKKLKDGESINNLEVIKLLNGQKLWLNQTYKPIINSEGIPYKVLNIAIDITESKLQEQDFEKQVREMNHKANEMKTLQSAINQAAIKCEYSPEGVILNANENFAELMGHPLDELVNAQVVDFYNSEEKEVFDDLWLKLSNKETYKANIRRVMPNGEERWVVSTFTPVLDEDGNIYKIYYLGQDITEQKQKFQLLVDANNEIERLKKLIEEK